MKILRQKQMKNLEDKISIAWNKRDIQETLRLAHVYNFLQDDYSKRYNETYPIKVEVKK